MELLSLALTVKWLLKLYWAEFWGRNHFLLCFQISSSGTAVIATTNLRCQVKFVVLYAEEIVLMSQTALVVYRSIFVVM